MKRIKKIILSKEEQKTLKDYYKMVEAFSEFTNYDIRESAEYLSEFIFDYWASFDYEPQRKYGSVEIELEGFKNE